MKPKLFLRLLAKFRPHKKINLSLKIQACELEWKLVAEQRKVAALENLLKSLVCSTSWVAHEQDQVRMQIAIDQRAVKLARDPDMFFQEAMRQLVGSLKRDMMQ